VTPPLLDTSFLVRYLSDDPPALAERATAVIDSDTAVSVSAVALAETAHLLRSVYRFPQEQIVGALLEIVQKENVQPLGLDRATVVEALHLCRPSGRVSVPDALIWAEARASGAGAVYSFDLRFPEMGIDVRRAETS
jgi:predicted nucleic acid-binding protein